MKKILLAVVLVLFLVACSEETVDLEGESVTYEELQEKIEEKESELSDLNGKIETAKQQLSSIKNEFSVREEEFNELEELVSNRDKLKTESIEYERELNKLESDIETAQKELEKLNGELISVAGEPIKIGAGYFYFGSDVDPGRYKLMPQEGQRGNVFIRRDGRSYVAETFGDGSRGSLTEFVFDSKSGDEIEATIPIYLYPAE